MLLIVQAQIKNKTLACQRFIKGVKSNARFQNVVMLMRSNIQNQAMCYDFNQIVDIMSLLDSQLTWSTWKTSKHCFPVIAN
jgi:hypothetical protein